MALNCLDLEQDLKQILLQWVSLFAMVAMVDVAPAAAAPRDVSLPPGFSPKVRRPATMRQPRGRRQTQNPDDRQQVNNPPPPIIAPPGASWPAPQILTPYNHLNILSWASRAEINR